MADITMCQNSFCAVRGLCYRYKAIPSQHQSYDEFVPKNEKIGCDYFICTFDIKYPKEINKIKEYLQTPPQKHPND